MNYNELIDTLKLIGVIVLCMICFISIILGTLMLLPPSMYESEGAVSMQNPSGGIILLIVGGIAYLILRKITDYT